MKGKNHFLSGIIFLGFIFAADLFFGLKLYEFLTQLNIVVVSVIFYLFIAGLLLPDADKFGSLIFKFFLPLALISWILGLLFSSIQGKRFRHRGFLHSSAGVILSSVVSSVLFYLLLSIFLNLELVVLILFVSSLLLGQLIHLLFD